MSSVLYRLGRWCFARVIPATMYLFKGAAWWLPRWMGRVLPDLDVEGSKLGEPVLQRA